MINRDLTPLDKFLAKVKDASRQGLKEVRLDTRDAIEITTLLAQILLKQQIATVTKEVGPTSLSKQMDGGKFK
jgi:hypothetical protein